MRSLPRGLSAMRKYYGYYGHEYYEDERQKTTITKKFINHSINTAILWIVCFNLTLIGNALFSQQWNYGLHKNIQRFYVNN